jgi:CubicO group peptidase (beta-lactamase class C family)
MHPARSVFLLLATFVVFCVSALDGDTATPQETNPSKESAAANPPPTTSLASAHALEKADLEAFFDGIVPLQLERSDVAGASVLVMKDGQELLKKGYGFSDLAKKKPVDPGNTVFRLASISKLFTWISVMQLVEQGKLDLDTDVNRYIDFQITPAFGKPITLRNLMTHTGGFEEEVRDILLVDSKKMKPLREYLIENQPRRMYPPGEISAYSNYGVGLGGYVVEHVSGEPFEHYVAEHIFQPLGMMHSSFDQPATQELSPFESEGYKESTEKPAVGFEIFSPAPAGGISSTAADMGRFGQALLNGGELDGHRILSAKSLEAMWTRQFAASEVMPAMCMGFYQVWRNGLHFVGHNGDLIAFHSMFLVEPKEKLILFVSYNSAGSARKTRTELLNDFADRYYPYKVDPAFQKIPNEELKAITGTYQVTRRADSTKTKLTGLTEQAQATLDKEGILKIEDAKDLRGHVLKWKPIGKDVWQEIEGQNRIQTIRDGAGKIARIAVSFPGVQYERVPWYENSYMILPVLCLSLAILLLVVVASLVRLGRRILFSKRPAWQAQPGTLRLTTGPRVAAFAWVILASATFALIYTLENQTLPPSHSVDKYFVLINAVAGIAIILSIFAVVASLRIWARADLRPISHIKFSLVGGACLFLTWFSIHWNIIGPAHRF